MMAATLASNSTSPTASLITRLFHHAENDPSHDAVVSSALRLSYAQLADLVRAQAGQFLDSGLSSDSVVGIKSADDSKHLVLCLAATHIGATSVAIPSHEPIEIQRSIADRCGVTHVIDHSIKMVATDGMDATGFSSTAAPSARLIFSTSGTSGEPKLVVHHDSDLVAQAHRHIGSKRERFACLASIEHNFARRHRLYCVAVGATNVFLDSDLGSLVAQCQALAVNVIHVSAFQAQELLAAPGVEKLSGARLKLGGSHVTAPLRRQLRKRITQNLHAGYGTTETGAISFTDPDDRDQAESVGRPLPGIEVRTVSPDRKPLAPGERGELAIRCDGMFRGYLGNRDLTASRLEGGWFYTGDIGYQDSQRRIHLCGRSDDMFVFNSINVYPQDLESRIRQFPGISDAVVLPRKSAVHGCIPVALIAFSKGAKPKLPALKKFVSEEAGIRSPRQYILVKEIPRNATGKIARREAARLSDDIYENRKHIIQALDPRTRDKLAPSLIAAFENGDVDIRLREIDMDSLARMELLVTLEVEHDLIITPKEFNERGSLGKIAACILSRQKQIELERETGARIIGPVTAGIATDAQPYVVRFFQRVLSYCHTVARLNRALTTLEHRLTPEDVALLHERHRRRQLIPASAAGKFHAVFALWIQRLESSLLSSGKTVPEPFVARRVAPAVTHFVGPGAPADKTLLICFSCAGSRSLMMPNSVLMQHTDSARYDLLVVAEPLSRNYELGVPLLGKSVTEAIESIGEMELIRGYRAIRTLGSSAGAYPALLGGHLLEAELAICVGGRFHSWRHPRKILDRVLTTRRAVRERPCKRALLYYGNDKTRDRNFAKIMAWLSGASLVAIEFTNGSVGHLILERLLERGELSQFLACTVFADLGDELVSMQLADAVLSFPEARIRPCRRAG